MLSALAINYFFLKPYDDLMYMSASIGIAVGSYERPEVLVRAADEASYRAKREGKARSVVFARDPTTGGAP